MDKTDLGNNILAIVGIIVALGIGGGICYSILCLFWWLSPILFWIGVALIAAAIVGVVLRYWDEFFSKDK